MTYLWDMLRETQLPVVIYGMGDGADKLFLRCEQFGVTVADIFASDEYVRGHTFRGYRVLKYSEVCEKYDDFIILLAFAAFEDELMAKITRYAHEHPLYAPDLPLFGGEILTPDWVKEHADDLRTAYSILADEQSKTVFETVLRYKLSGGVLDLRTCETPREEIFETIFRFDENETFLDLGAYNGDTVQEFALQTSGIYRGIIAVEPDKKNYEKLLRATAELHDVRCENVGIWETNGILSFSGGGGRASCLTPDAVLDAETSKKYHIPVDTIDRIVGSGDVTYIKMDVEGAEHEALEGGRETIIRCHPKLAVSAYHRTHDFLTLILKLHAIDPTYRIYLRHHPYIPAWETNIYAI